MASVHEQLSEQFQKWERRGRGWQVFSEPVYPEPPFVPFEGHYLPEEPTADDGRRATFLSSFVQRLSRKLSTAPPALPEPTTEEEEPEPLPLLRDSLIELQASLPDKLDISSDRFAQFLTSVSLCHEPLAFEILGAGNQVSVQFASHPDDAPLLRRQLQAHFPEAVFIPRESVLSQAWDKSDGAEAMAVEFGLANEFMLPLQRGSLDAFVGIVGALSELEQGELGLFQVLWQPVQNPWPASILRSVAHADGKPYFVNMPELAAAAASKAAAPLFACVVRLLLRGKTFDRVLQLARDLSGSLRVFENPTGNHLIPLSNEEYPFPEHIEDALFRQTRRSGMLLGLEELIGFVHLPSSAVRSPAFIRQAYKTKAAPFAVRQNAGVLLGYNEHAGETISVRLTAEQRMRHCHIIGASGTGKSTLLFNLIQEDIKNGEGLAVLDPHGDLIDRVLEIIPENRFADVVFVDPADTDYSIPFNILSAHSDLEKTLLASDLVAVFERLSTSWGDQMNSVLQNAILAFLESHRGGTIADLRRFLIEPAFRNAFLESVTDSEVVYYWQKSFPHLAGNKSIGSILTRLDTFLAQKPIRYMVAQPENRLDFTEIMDTGKIFLAKLPEGLLGRENSFLLGTLLVAKFQQIAMSRQAKQASGRKDFFIFADEFANFITPSMAEILSGARKYRIGLTLAHHDLHQLHRSPEVASAVMTHPFTRVCFRVGDDDARKLSESLSFFEAKDLRNLETGQAICRVERSDFDFNLVVPPPDAPHRSSCQARKEAIIEASRRKYGTRRTDVEAMLAKSRQPLPRPAHSSTLPSAASVAAAAQLKAETPDAQHIPPRTPSQSPPPAELPKEATTQKETVSEKKTVEVPPMDTAPALRPIDKPKRSEMTVPPDLGRGGAQHQAIQKRIKDEGERLGFRCVVEKQILAGQGSVDLALERGQESIACEISISTTIDHEVRNVSKCIKAGFPKVAIVCIGDERLEKIKRAVNGSLGMEVGSRILYFQPDAFIAELRKMQVADSGNPSQNENRRGWNVKRTFTSMSLAEQKQKEAELHRVLQENMRPQKRK